MAALLERLERGQRRRARLGLGAAAVVALAVAAGVGAAFGAAERSPVDRPSEPRDPKIERHISAAMAEYQALDFAEARIALRRAAELDPADGVVRLYLADTLRWLDRPVAEIHNELALALASDDLSAAQIAFAKNLGLLVDHDYPAAITGFEVAVATDPDSTLLLYGLFESLVHGGRPGAALPIDRRIRELDPSFALHTFHVLEYCAAIDDVARVRGVHQDAARDELGTWEIWEARLLAREGRREEGIRLLQAWTNAHGPESFWASQELMMLLLRGQHDEELAAYASQPRFMRLPEYGLALLHADASSLDARLTDALAFTTNDGHGAGGHRGWLLLGAAIVAGAQRESILRWAVEYERERRLAQGSSARMAVLQLYVDEALGRPIAAVPDPTEPQFEAEAIVAAMAARRRGDVAGAIAKWREVVTLAPDSALSGLALMEQAKAEASAGDHLAVIETCRRVLEPIKTSWTWAGTAGPCLRLRADAFASLGRSADARTDYRRILSLRRDAPAHDALAAAARAGLIELGSG
jgi:tetratricopeptide (TPR) repeat protein